MISYEVKLASPVSHTFQITMRLPNPVTPGQIVYLPAWIRGSYMIRDFARHIVSIEAACNGIPVTLEKLDKQSWSIPSCDNELVLTYSVYAWDLSVRAAHLDTTHAYFNGPSVFLAAHGKEAEVCQVTILPPDIKQLRAWQVATGMQAVKVDSQGFGSYKLPDYEALLDHPVEIGVSAQKDFSVAEVEHRLVVSGRQRGDLDRLCTDLRKICIQNVELFGELPLDRYLFLLWVVGDGYGGLEHRNSTSLMCNRGDLPHPGMTEMTEGYRRLLGLCSHEYFHLWNIKRIMPAVFQETGTGQEVYTRQLWVFEGITSYYDELALVRSRVITKECYFELLAETITRVMRGSGRYKQTLEESSFDAWTKFYKQDENAANAIVSYYSKGALFALTLDLHIRLQTHAGVCLDDVMRRMWLDYGKTGIGVPERGFEQVAAEVTGLDLSELFDLGLRSHEDLPLSEMLQPFGVELHMLPARSTEDKGSVSNKPPVTDKIKGVLGAKVVTSKDEVKIVQVFDHGAAQSAGLSSGDVILAVDYLRLNEKQLEQCIATAKPGIGIKFHVFRRDELMEFDLIPQPTPADTCVFYLPDDLSEERLSRRKSWLHEDGNKH